MSSANFTCEECKLEILFKSSLRCSNCEKILCDACKRHCPDTWYVPCNKIFCKSCANVCRICNVEIIKCADCSRARETPDSRDRLRSKICIICYESCRNCDCGNCHMKEKTKKEGLAGLGIRGHAYVCICCDKTS